MTTTEQQTTFIYGKPATKAQIESLATDRVVLLPLDRISVEEGFNVRDFSAPENKDHIDRLAKLIAASGVEVPVFVRIEGERIILTDGESRIRAAYKAKDGGAQVAGDVPALLDPYGDDLRSRTKGLVVRNSGRTLNMLETLAVVKRLKTDGETTEQIRSAFGFSAQHMRNLNLLDQAPDSVKETVVQGRVSSTLVVDLMRENKGQPEVVARAIESAVRKMEAIEQRGPSDGKVTKRKIGSDDGIVYTRASFNGLVGTLQKLYAGMTPAADYRKWRGWVKNALENVGAPLEAEEETTEETEA